MNRTENRASALGENFQRLLIANGDVASIDLNKTVLLQSRQRPRHDFAHRAYAGGDLLVGQSQRHFETRVAASSARPRLGYQPPRHKPR